MIWSLLQGDGGGWEASTEAEAGRTKEGLPLPPPATRFMNKSQELFCCLPGKNPGGVCHPPLLPSPAGSRHFPSSIPSATTVRTGSPDPPSFHAPTQHHQTISKRGWQQQPRPSRLMSARSILMTRFACLPTTTSAQQWHCCNTRHNSGPTPTP